MGEVISIKREDEVITSSSAPLDIERDIERLSDLIADKVSKQVASVVGQTLTSEELVQRQAVQPTPPESLYTRDSYLVKMIEILDQCRKQLELALEEYEDEIRREDAMLRFVHYLNKVSYLAMLFNINHNFEDIITAIQVGIKNKKGEPYTREEITTLRYVVKTLRQGPIMSDQTYERCLHALDKEFKPGLFEEVDLKI